MIPAAAPLRLLIATTNQGKTREIRAFLAAIPIQTFSLLEFHPEKTYLEKGKTFLENARGKSLFYSREWEGLTLAEDSGLEIEHLKGAPGILSARYSGLHSTDKKNIEKVLRLIADVPPEKRKACFVSCMVLASKGQIVKEIEEHVQGHITFEPRGRFGFGYDPIFFYPPLKKTFAELLPAQKNEISHRGKALIRLKAFLLNYPARSL